jgi:hypothetical protein
MSKIVQDLNPGPQPPWLDGGERVRLDDGGRGIVAGSETGCFGTVYRVRMPDLSTCERSRDDLVVLSKDDDEDGALEELALLLVVEHMLES